MCIRDRRDTGADHLKIQEVQSGLKKIAAFHRRKVMKVASNAVQTRQPAFGVNQSRGTNNRNQRAQPAQITIADREEDKNQKQNILQKVQREISESSE